MYSTTAHVTTVLAELNKAQEKVAWSVKTFYRALCPQIGKFWRFISPCARKAQICFSNREMTDLKPKPQYFRQQKY